ncbi:DUF2971 domain-containing protein [Sinorhizobium mexicanum]|uniref:DUF2971 domain-containing protein n=1 Tax=Sinorhizobium mexicanum TaxID=375549 RepID=A0A859QQD7_9HYPH|nr:DUF2971 domain-containing protein [Sinorhizobium mexicanum]MBP1881945.1 hypothetical protein [Sinorhizobium mexicanum]QLL61679.1 DUF2971 domain-containing protein [Sinorhizobium mexicanum]
MLQKALELSDIFAPHEAKRRDELFQLNRRLIHYTSAAAAVSIIRNSAVWMRNVLCMNDYMEVEHGFQLMRRSFEPPVDSESERGLRAVAAALDAIFPEISKDCIDWFNGWLFALRNKTYVTCLSEHHPSENEYGRLSMWRSYTASQVGVGLIINPLPLYSLSQTFGAFSSPVYYFGDVELRDTFFEIASNVTANKDLLASKGADEVKGYFCMLLRGIAMCTKHPGFHEEKEWRIMHTQGLDEQGALLREVEIINGVPQPVFKIPLKDHLESGMTGISIPDLLEHVIIGPTEFPMPVKDAIVIELEKAGVKDAETKVSYSNIPLRT